MQIKKKTDSYLWFGSRYAKVSLTINNEYNFTTRNSILTDVIFIYELTDPELIFTAENENQLIKMYANYQPKILSLRTL